MTKCIRCDGPDARDMIHPCAIEVHESLIRDRVDSWNERWAITGAPLCRDCCVAYIRSTRWFMQQRVKREPVVLGRNAKRAITRIRWLERSYPINYKDLLTSESGLAKLWSIRGIGPSAIRELRQAGYKIPPTPDEGGDFNP